MTGAVVDVEADVGLVRPSDAAFHRRAFFFIPNEIRLLILKDLRTFRRDPAQWSQFLIFFGLLAFYFINIRRLSYDVQKPYWRNLISFLNLSVTALILSTFTSRFIFPLLSLEGQELLSPRAVLPLKARRVDPLGQVRVLRRGSRWWPPRSWSSLSDLMLRMGPATAPIVLHMGMVAILCFGLSGISVGLGARLPNLKEDALPKIAAGFGGTLNLLVSLVFICAIVMSLAVPCHLYFAGQDNSPEVGGMSLSETQFQFWFARRDRDEPGRRDRCSARCCPCGIKVDQGLPQRMSSSENPARRPVCAYPLDLDGIELTAEERSRETVPTITVRPLRRHGRIERYSTERGPRDWLEVEQASRSR